MKVTATKIKAAELKPGDLFSIADQQCWDNWIKDEFAVGLKVYLRTDAMCPIDQREDEIFLIEIT